MKKYLVAVTIAILVGCATAPPAPAPTPAQIQSIQTREFETTKTIAFASVISVFQDLGYTVASADKETGFITSASASTSKTDYWFTGQTINTQTKATAFVEDMPNNRARVRLNFVVTNKASTVYGQNRDSDVPILDAKVYESAFEKIDDAIFTRSGSN